MAKRSFDTVRISLSQNLRSGILSPVKMLRLYRFLIIAISSTFKINLPQQKIRV